MPPISIGSYKIGTESPPFIVAEMSGNHNQSLQTALRLVDAAKAAGAHAVKLQTYTADTMTINMREGEFLISDPKSLWYGYSFYDLYQKAHTPWEWHAQIFAHCKKLGLIGFSTPFDATAVDFLESLDVPCYKIASLEIVDHPLIAKAASTGKPLMISTGGATLQEISEATEVAREAGCRDLILLKCTCSYPAPANEANLRTIPHLIKRFETPVGLSDHSLGIGVPIASVAFGACVIEKHLALSRKEGGVDAAFSLEPQELQQLVIESRRAWEALGEIQDGPTDSEKNLIPYRRSLYFVEQLKKGETISSKQIRAIRPGRGLHPKEFPNLMGKKALRDIKRGEPVSWDLIDWSLKNVD